jgi:hypothetical protein
MKIVFFLLSDDQSLKLLIGFGLNLVQVVSAEDYQVIFILAQTSLLKQSYFIWRQDRFAIVFHEVYLK